MVHRSGYRQFAVVLDAIDGEDVLRVFGDVDRFVVHELEQALNDAARSGRSVVLDLSSCRYIDTSCLTVMIRAHRRFDGRLRVQIAPGSIIARILALTQLTQALSVSEVDVVPRAPEPTSIGHARRLRHLRSVPDRIDRSVEEQVVRREDL